MANYTSTIGGTLVNVIAGSLHVENQIGQRSTGGLGVWTNAGTIWQYGTQVQIFDDTGAKVYSGFTTKDKVRKAAGGRLGTGFLEHDIALMDNCYKADKRRVFQSYLGFTAGQIVTDLLGRYLSAEGVVSLPGSIAAGITMPQVIISGTKSVGDTFTYLAQQSGYWWNIDVNNVLWFQPYGGIPAPFTMDGTQADAAKDLSVEFGNDMYVNKQYAKGAFAEKKNQSNTFHGDGTTRAFTCSFPLSSKVTVTLNGAAQTLGTKGVDNGKPFYWAVGDAVVAQDPSGTPLGGGDTLVVTYNGRYPILAVAQNPALIAAQQAREGGGTGLVESVFSNTKVHDQGAAFQIAGSLLSHYGQDTTVLTFATRTKGLQPGQLLTVNLPDFGLNNKAMLISGVSISDQVDGYNVWFVVKCVGSPVESAQWQTFFQNLMNQNASDPNDLASANDTSLAFLLASTVSTTMTATVTKTTAVCPIFGNATLFSNSTVFC